MTYVKSNGHVLDDVTCPVFLLITQCVFHATFRVDKITWKYRKTAKYRPDRKKSSVYHTVDGNLYCFTHRKQQKW